MTVAYKKESLITESIESQIEDLIEQAWDALFRASVTTKLYRRVPNGISENTELVNSKVTLLPSFDREGNYLMARVSEDQDVRLYDQIEIGGFRFEVVSLGERSSIGPREFVEVIAKRRGVNKNDSLTEV
jgi:hypothetical protein